MEIITMPKLLPRLLPLLLLLSAQGAQGQEMDLSWLAKPKLRPIVLDFDAMTAGCYASGTVVGGVPVSIARAGANATYWDGVAWQPCAANTLRIAPEGYLAEPTRSQAYPTPTAPAAGTSSALAVGTWHFRCEGTGSQPISAGTAVGTGWGTSSNGSVVTLTITGAGTATLGAVTGSLSRCDLQGAGSFYTSHIPSGSGRNGDLASIPVAWGSRPNRWCISGLYEPETNHTWPAAATASGLWQTGGSSGANTAWVTNSNGTLIFSVIDGAAVQKYVSYNGASLGASHHWITGINDNGTLSFYIDDLPYGSVLGAGTGLWSTAPGTMAIGYRADATDAFGGFVRKVVISPGVSDLSRCLASTAPDDAHRVATIGDSITFGAYATTPYGTTLMDTLGASWLVANHGVNSDTTALMLARWTSTIRGRHYGKVIFLGGINDIRLNVALATTQANITQILSEAKSDGAQIMVMSLLPAGGSTPWDAGKEANRVALNSWLQTQAVANGWIFVDTATDFDNGSQALKPPYDSGDHLHPNETGTARIAADDYTAGQSAGWWP